MGRKEGMRTMEESLAALYRAGKISYEEAALRAARSEEFNKLLE
jgi:Tfp pilus assembly pilus retraction ATPase PilT